MDAELDRVEEAVADFSAYPAWSASTEDSVVVIRRIQTMLTQLTAVQAAYALELNGRGFPASQAATSMSTWLHDALRIPVHTATQLLALGRLLDTRPALSDAVTSGLLTAAQAHVIGDTLADLETDLSTPRDPDPHDCADPSSNGDGSTPDGDTADRRTAADARSKADAGSKADVPAEPSREELLTSCESALILHGETLEPAALRIAGSRILAHVAPGIADAVLKAKLDHEEARAHRARSLTITPIGHGQTRLSALLDTESAATLRAAIEPLTRPQPTAIDPAPGNRDLRDLAQRRADALIDVCRLALATESLPENGGDRPQITVTVDYDVLRRQIGVGTLDTGETLSASAVRRLACDARIIPAVLGSHGEVLDLGRSRRLCTGLIRRALVLRDRGCAFPGCDRPPRWTDGHHIRSWFDGGPSDLANTVLLCRRHHRVMHQPATADAGWMIRIADDGHPEFIPPDYIDPLRRPQRNIYHQRT